MAQNQQPNVPQEMRDLAERNIDQARADCGQLMDAARKAQEMMKSLPAEPGRGQTKRGSGAGNEVHPAEPRREFLPVQ
jgi:hypothetical protein